MPSTKSVLMAAAIAFSGTVSGHMMMATPKPFGAGRSLNNSPLSGDGSDFPCKAQGGVYDSQGISNTMPQGSTQKLSFIGSAVHGGGSCQISLTTDPAPTKKSVFKVIHSIEGGCPARNVDGNLPENAKGTGAGTYDFTIPKDLAAGDYTLAWTWFNRVGNPEMYMNCAPITVTGGSGGPGNGTAKRDEGSLIGGTRLNKRAAGSLGSLSSAPDMFVANIGKDCATKQSGPSLKFPNPGSSVEILASSFDPPNCSGSTGPGSSPPSGGPSSPASGSPATSAALPSNTGGIFVPSAASGASSAASSTPSVASTTPSSPPVAAPSSGPSAPVNGSGTGSGSGSGGALSGTCTPEGSFNCVGGTSFQQCASGSWSIVQPMASGTKCTPGQTQTLNIMAGKRTVRFSRGHAHRRHNPYLDTY